MAKAQASMSPGAARHPVWPGRTVSVVPPWSEAITGRPMTWGSTAARPKDSGTRVGNRAISAAMKAAGMSSQCPTSLTTPSRSAAPTAASREWR